MSGNEINFNYRSIKCEEDFFVLKFPCKLWRIVNESQTMAIRWGQYGKTILIDYIIFQDEYLQCEIPKFKTKNMTSFVRQLNMYGFKKLQSQNRNSNIHEFFNEHFRFGRPDLLRFVKRRVITLTGFQRKLSRIEHIRKKFDEKFQESQLFHHFWDLSKYNHTFVEGDFVIDPEYKIQVISAENVTFDGDFKKLWAEIDGDYDGLLQTDLDKTESESDDGDDDDDDTISIPSTDGNYVWPTAQSPVKVKSGFDGSCFTIEIVKHSEEIKEDLQTIPENMQTQEGGPQIKTPILEEDVSVPTIHLPELDGENDLFSCLSSALTILD